MRACWLKGVRLLDVNTNNRGADQIMGIQRPDILMHCACGASIQIDDAENTYNTEQRRVLTWWREIHADCKPPTQRACTQGEWLEKRKRGYYGQ